MLIVRPSRHLRIYKRGLRNACHIRHAHRHANKNTGQTVNLAIAPKPQPTELSEDGARTLRVRRGGNKSLPMPPIMDPLAVEKKEKKRKPKPLANEVPKTSFQTELELNPYGQSWISSTVYESKLLTKQWQPKL